MNTRCTLLHAASVLAAFGGAAQAQHALGDGTRLDRNLMRGSSGVNPPGRDLSAEIRFRNGIITGNAPGGFSFRGDVGYRAPGEFMGTLGSNELFRYRRDTVYSGLAGLGIRGTDALQYQFALTTGNAPPQGFVGPGLVERSGRSAVASEIRRGELPVADPNLPVRELPASDPRADPRGQELWTLRSTSGFVSTRGLSPSVIGMAPGSDGRGYNITASQLRGLSVEPAYTGQPQEQPVEPRPEPPPGSARPADLKAPLEAPGGEAESKSVAARPAGAAPVTFRSGYDELIERLSRSLPGEERAEQSKLPLWQQRINEARRDLEQAQRLTAKPGEEEPAGDEPTGPGGFRAETLRMLKESRGQIGKLAPPEGSDAYSAHMRRAEEYLKHGQYFFAEERFRAALSVKPDDPMAAIGRIHAQLGASLFASAALNLRMLLISHPELVGARYEANLLPDPARIQRILDRLNTVAESGKVLGRDSGLLIAYLGYQTRDPAAVERGLTIMEQLAPGETPDPQLQKLGALLREVWTAPATPEQGR